MSKKYITTTLPYVNADPHIGFALEIVQADTIARYWKLQGADVVFNTGTDEHGQKIYQAALKEGKDTQAYCDEYAAKFNELKSALNLSYTHFIRTTDKHHVAAAQEFWQRCDKNGDIYKKNYKIKYCVGCELEKTDSELVNDCCPLHPNLKLEIIEEENYFFRFSKYQQKLLELYEKNPQFVVPDFRLKEIKNFVENGLEDFSISRLKSKMPWGVNVPGDPEHVMYVWFDALVNYISTLGWPDSAKASPGKPNEFDQWWGSHKNPNAIQIAGKDNLRQQSAMWQAMLMSAGLPTSKQIIIHGFVTSDGQKISKSLGNVINPVDLVRKYRTDAVRYFLLKEIPPFDDGDFSYRRMEEVYNSDLANVLGNLISRVTNLCEQNEVTFLPEKEDTSLPATLNTGGFIDHLNRFEFNLALEELWRDFKSINGEINRDEPWNLEKDQIMPYLRRYLKEIRKRTYWLQIFLPETAEKIMQSTQGKIKKSPPLFPRI
ncbi:MAG: methionine--tRNA ligase [Candidatus Roizmanbacteria bacterium]|nr:MAG: methionine--tRNA ligase [Candidatus Roizmanbacteria bacterium]